MRHSPRIVFIFVLAIMLLAFPRSLTAQATPSGRGPTGESKKQEKGWTLYESFEGSSSSEGQVTELKSTFGYNFNRYFGWDVGVPVFFVRATSSSSTTGTTSRNGLGDVYTNLRLNLANPLLNLSSTLTGTAPSGDTSKGLSTGRATFDWSNRVDRGIGRLTPFVEAGVGNSIGDTRFFKRPFVTLGRVSHFEAGSDVSIWKSLSFTASAYDVLPWGQQRVFSRVAPGTSGATSPAAHGRVFETSSETVGTADLTRDNGFSAGLSFNPFRPVTFAVGYTRSIHFALDVVSFGIGVDLSSLVRHNRNP